MSDQLRDALNSKFSDKQDVIQAWPGIIGDDNNVIDVPGLPNTIYIRLSDRVAQVYNDRVSPSLDLPVWVGFDPLQPELPQVLSVRAARPRYGEDDGTFYHVTPHHKSHEYPSEDAVFVQTRQILPFRVSAAGDMNIAIYRNVAYLGGEYREVTPSEFTNLSSYLLAGDAAEFAKYLLIEISTAGAVNVVVGTQVDFYALALSDIPDPTTGAYPVAAIRIYSGQTEISESRNSTDIIDLRFSFAAERPSLLTDYITFNSGITVSPGARSIWWNDTEYTVNIETGLGPTLQIGQEVYILIYNDTGLDIDNFSVMRPVGAFVVSGTVFPTPQLAKADIWETCEGTIFVATMDIPNGSVGIATRFGRARGGDTSGYSAPGIGLYISDTVAGLLTETMPVFPSFSISVGGLLTKDAADGEIFVTITRDIFDTTLNFWNGIIRESIDFLVTSDGATVTGSLTNQDDALDLTLIFSDGFYILDTTPAKTITLTPGTDINPQMNYVYITKAAKVLAVSTAGWPSEEHIRVANIVIRSAATTQVDGALSNQNHNDHIQGTDGQGHLSHITAALREKLPATWLSGTEGSLVVDTVPATDTAYAKLTAGVVKQLHDQSIPAFDMTQYTIDAVSIGSSTFTISGDGDLTSTFFIGKFIRVSGSTGNDGFFTVLSVQWSDPDFIITVNETIPDATADGTIGDQAHLVNDSSAAYTEITDLALITADAAGATTNNKWISVVLWGLANKSGEISHLMINLPNGGYNTEAAAVSDLTLYSVYDIPNNFSGTGFLIARFTFRRSGGSITYNPGVGYEDLRGTFANTAAGGGGSGGGGVSTWLGLTDTPSAYTSQAGKLSRVNSGETGIELADLSDIGAMPSDGWLPISATWTRTGDHTFTVSGDVTGDANYQPGTKVKYDDGAVDFGTIDSLSYGAPNTTITLISNDDYAMAAATITATYISHIETPDDFPVSFTYTPVINNLTIGNGSVSAFFVVRSKIIKCRLSFIHGSTSAITGTLTIDLPSSMYSFPENRPALGITTFRDDSEGDNYIGNSAYNGTAGKITPQVVDSSATYAIISGTNATKPFTWAVDDELSMFFEYPIE